MTFITPKVMYLGKDSQDYLCTDSEYEVFMCRIAFPIIKELCSLCYLWDNSDACMSAQKRFTTLQTPQCQATGCTSTNTARNFTYPTSRTPLNWASFNSDMNLIKHLWDYLLSGQKSISPLNSGDEIFWISPGCGMECISSIHCVKA